MKKGLLTILCLLVFTTSFAQETDSTAVHQPKTWGFSITPYALFAANSTDVGGERIRQSFKDLTSITKTGFQITGKVRYKKVYVLFDGTFATLGQASNEGVINLEYEIQQNIYDFRAGYIVFDNYKVKGDQVISGWDLSFNAGAKYWLNDITLKYQLGNFPEGDLNTKQDWWDLMLGVQARFMITPRFVVGVSGSAGGFNIGNSSDFSYDFIYLNTFKVHKNVFVNAGYRNFRYTMTEADLETTVNVLGPFVGLTGSF